MRKIAIVAAAALLAVSGAVFADYQGPLLKQRGAELQQQQLQRSKSGSTAEIDDHSSHTINNDYPVAQAWAPPLTATEDTCMGSSSAGVQGASFGVSFGTTWRDGDCVRRKDARLLHNMGLHGPAAALMCQKEAIAQAFADAGVPCVSPSVQASREVISEPMAETAPVTTVAEQTAYRLPPVVTD